MTKQQIKSTDEIKQHLSEIRTKLLALEEQNRLMVQILEVHAKGTRPDIRPDVAKIVLKDIQEHPGTVRKDIVERTNLAPQEVTKTVMLLEEQEQVLHLGSRRTTRWFSPEVLKELLNK